MIKLLTLIKLLKVRKRMITKIFKFNNKKNRLWKFKSIYLFNLIIYLLYLL